MCIRIYLKQKNLKYQISQQKIQINYGKMFNPLEKSEFFQLDKVLSH